MGKKFNELFDLWDEENKAQKKDKHLKYLPFSKEKFTALTVGLLNDPDYEADIVKQKNGEPVHEKSTPVKDFRTQMVEKVLLDYGVDKAEASKAAQDYQFSNRQAESIYPIITESIDKYMDLGYAFKFPSRDDFSCSIYKRSESGGEKVYKDPRTKESIKMKIAPHKILIKKGGAPDWKKQRV